MTEPTKTSFYDAARSYDIILGPLRFEAFAANPQMKCADAVMDAYQMVGSQAKFLGEIAAMKCNSSMPVASTVESFAVKHNMPKRSDLGSCATLSSSIDDKARALLTSKGWIVSEHMLQSQSGMTISFVDTDPNQSAAVTFADDSSVLLTIVECSGNTIRFKLNVDTSELSAA